MQALCLCSLFDKLLFENTLIFIYHPISFCLDRQIYFIEHWAFHGVCQNYKFLFYACRKYPHFHSLKGILQCFVNIKFLEECVESCTEQTTFLEEK